MASIVKVQKKEIEFSMQKLCDRILQIGNIEFAGIVDPFGNLFAGSFRQGTTPKISDEKRRHMYMRFALESCFRKDFDDVLGPFRFSITQREKGSILTTSICDHLLLVFTELHIYDTEFIKKIQKIIIENEPTNFHSDQ